MSIDLNFVDKCSLCHALVESFDMDDHKRWHTDRGEVLPEDAPGGVELAASAAVALFGSLWDRRSRKRDGTR